MNKYVKNPNLPADCAGIIISGRYYHIYENKLKSLSIRAFLMPDDPKLPQGTAHHTDLSVFHADDDQLVISQSFKGSAFEDELLAEGFEIKHFELKQSAEYPHDAGGNVCYFGDHAFLNPASADPAIINCLNEKNAVITAVKQGYTKCNICVLDEHSIITNDRVIAEKAEKQGIDALFSDPSAIRLEGYAHGFIGGSAFKISDDTLCFTGVLDGFETSEKRKILEFCEKKQIRPIYLSDLPLFDIGGAVPVLER